MEMELAMIVDLMFCWSRLLSGVMQQMNLLAKGRNMIFRKGLVMFRMWMIHMQPDNTRFWEQI